MLSVIRTMLFLRPTFRRRWLYRDYNHRGRTRCSAGILRYWDMLPDHVGNESRICYGTTEFALESSVKRILEPQEPVFKCGESGILTFTTWGYARDRVEVIFPECMTALNPTLNKVYDYTESQGIVRRKNWNLWCLYILRRTRHRKSQCGPIKVTRGWKIIRRSA